jgi:hypothetical protein
MSTLKSALRDFSSSCANALKTEKNRNNSGRKFFIGQCVFKNYDLKNQYNNTLRPKPKANRIANSI